MKLYEYLEECTVKKTGAVIYITGGGGKTTLMESFGEYLKHRGYSVLLTTTTKVASPKQHNYRTDKVFGDESVLGYMPKKGESVFFADHSYDIKKWIAPRMEVLSLLNKRYDIVLIEADGSKGLPFKYHTERDPVVYDDATAVIAVCGIWGIGSKAYEMCFGDGRECIIDKRYMDEYLRDSEGLTKGMRNNTKNLILFNGADEVDSSVLEMLSSLELPKSVKGVIGSERDGSLYGTI
ncbi:MAG: putative selenium-dependent hydroxylase accessory protein YqeC [Spirochaetales bacterium]|nr:putative selenium-dependent hydroxylase accessory protein YqeC [Spirochaetales bacterium]